MKRIHFFLFAPLLTNCTSQSEIVKVNQTLYKKLREEIVSTSDKVNYQSTVETLFGEKTYSTSIKNTKGLIVLSDQYGKDDFIRFYNEDSES